MLYYVYLIPWSTQSLGLHRELDCEFGLNLNKPKLYDTAKLSEKLVLHANNYTAVESGAARHSQGFEDKNLESSPGLLGQ